jgi:DNA-binding transcriptional ArsR family regulator
MLIGMARASTTSDVFNAIAEPQRRRILSLLKRGECPVNDVARALSISQPRASKHLRVLREVGLVRVRGQGKQRLHGLDARGLKPVHEWAGGFEEFWSGSFARLNEYVKELQLREEKDDKGQ